MTDDYDNEPWYNAIDDDCCHEEYEDDILTGIATCDQCGHRWLRGADEIEAEIQRIAAYQDYEDLENRRQWWRDLLERVRSILPRRKRTALPVDDDLIPF